VRDDDWLLELLELEKKEVPNTEFRPGDLVKVGAAHRVGIVMDYYWNHELEGWHYRVLLCGKLAIFPSKLLNSCNVRQEMVQ